MINMIRHEYFNIYFLLSTFYYIFKIRQTNTRKTILTVLNTYDKSLLEVLIELSVL